MHHKVNINFGDLPLYIIERGISIPFKEKGFRKEVEYLEWENSMNQLYDTIPKKYINAALEKGIEYAKELYANHRATACPNPTTCVLNQSWERRIAITEKILIERNPAPEPESQSVYTSQIPIIPLTSFERLWLQEIYTWMLNGSAFTFRTIYTALHEKLPVHFKPSGMNPAVVSSNGEEIKLAGVIALEKNYTILETINIVIRKIRSILLKEPDKTVIMISEIETSTRLQPPKISLALQLIQQYEQYFNSAAYDADKRILKSIGLNGNEAIYYRYINFPGIEQLMLTHTFKSYAPSGEKFTPDEMIAMSKKLDTILAEIETLKMGQEITWEDVLKELGELKALYTLDKKNWNQLFIGKLFNMVASGIISETVSKKIVEEMAPVFKKFISY